MDSSVNVLEIEGLRTHIRLTRTTVRAVDGVSLHIAPGETLGLVGESGCGKSITGMSIMKLLPSGGNIVEGSIKLNGRDVVPLPEKEMRNIRGNEVAVIFQDPMTSLNPTMTIGDQIGEVLHIHRKVSDDETQERCAEVLGLVGMPRPKERLSDYPHQLSGGLRQRVMIAMALVCDPKLLIADEPTTALDVTIQAQILDLLDDLRRRLHMAVLLITHDMGVIAGRADRVAVMYAGKIVEQAETRTLFKGMRHRYTEALVEAIPRLDQDAATGLYSIPGLPPDLTAPPPACRFAARCRFDTALCHAEEPTLIEHEAGHYYACHHPAGVGERAGVATAPTA
ncbi:MAG: ABC transporter ATP-binding protein [Candidatus Dormiibacterota bacterium]